MEQREAGELKWKRSSRTQQEIEDMTPDNEQAWFDLRKPESSAWMQEILREATCADMERRLCALWRFQKIFPLLVREQGLAEGAECASYLLKRGFMRELQEGLIEAKVSGEWLLLPKSKLKLGLNDVFFINRVAIYVETIVSMALDERTARFFLTEIKQLLKLLEALFNQAAHPSLAKLTQHFKRMDPEPKADARRSIVRAVSSLVEWSGKAKRSMLNRKDFYLGMLQEVVEVLKSRDLTGDELYVMINSGLALIINLNESFPASEQESLLEDVLVCSHGNPAIVRLNDESPQRSPDPVEDLEL